MKISVIVGSAFVILLIGSIRLIESMMDIVYPTQTCRADVRAYLKQEPKAIAREGLCRDDLYHYYTHQWAEKDDQAISWGVMHGKRIQFTMPRTDFYKVMNCEDVKDVALGGIKTRRFQ